MISRGIDHPANILVVDHFVYGRILDIGRSGGRFGICASSLSKDAPYGEWRIRIGGDFTEQRGLEAYAFSPAEVKSDERLILSYFAAMNQPFERGGLFLVPSHHLVIKPQQFLALNGQLNYLYEYLKMQDFPRLFSAEESLSPLILNVEVFAENNRLMELWQRDRHE